MRKSIWLAAAALALPTAVAACPMSYDTFELAVPHLDLETCPAELAVDGTFCRAAMALHGLAVYQFADDEGERCLVRVVRFEEDEVALTLRRE